jgi:hypothetical protein
LENFLFSFKKITNLTLIFTLNDILCTGVSLDGIDGPDWDINLNDSLQDSEEELDENQVIDEESYERELRFNNSIREIFLNRFVHIFASYEHFVIQPNQVSLHYSVVYSSLINNMNILIVNTLFTNICLFCYYFVRPAAQLTVKIYIFEGGPKQIRQ